MFTARQLLTGIRRWLIFFMAALLVSGLTAFPIETLLKLLCESWPVTDSRFYAWIQSVYFAVANTNQLYPFMAYGTDWLAFAHIILTILFVGPLINPVKNIWVIQFGCIACLAILPLAFIAGPIRQIPFYWQLIDASFGIFGLIPLTIIYRKTKQLEKLLAEDPCTNKLKPVYIRQHG